MQTESALDPHAVEDAVTSGERPKATRHATHTFVTVYGTHLEAGANAQLGALESRLQVSRLSAFVLPNGIVTVRFDARFDMEQVVQRWVARPVRDRAIPLQRRREDHWRTMALASRSGA